MTTSEKIRLFVIIILIVVYIARRFGWFEKLRETRQRKQQAEAKQQMLASRKDRRQQARQLQATQKVQTAEILRRGLGQLHQKTIQAAGQEVWYLDSGPQPEAPTVVLLHGFAGDKENWNELGNLLVDQGYRVIAPDLPGFGQNAKNPDLTHDITSQTKRVRAFIQQLKLQDYHLIGHSIGGSIAAAITYAASGDVNSLTMIEPFGIHLPYQSELDKLLEQDRNPMVIANPAAYNNLLGFVYHEPVEIPASLKKRRAEQAADHRVFYLKMWKEVREGERANLLDLLLPEIKIKTLIIQGAESKVIHPATPDVARSMMQGAEVAVIPECGHFPMIEKTQATAEHLLSFLPKPVDSSMSQP